MAENTNPLIPEDSNSIFRRRKGAEIYEGTPVDQVTQMSLESTTGGVILRVTGQSLRQGAFDVRLVPVNRGEPVEGVITFDLMALQPENRIQGSARSRSLTVATFLSRQKLDGAKLIKVRGARNELTSRR